MTGLRWNQPLPLTQLSLSLTALFCRQTPFPTLHPVPGEAALAPLSLAASRRFVPWNEFCNGCALCGSGTPKPACRDSAAAVIWTDLQRHSFCCSPSPMHGAVSKSVNFLSHTSLLFWGPDITYTLINVRTGLLKSVSSCGAYSVTTWCVQRVTPHWLPEGGSHAEPCFTEVRGLMLGKTKWLFQGFTVGTWQSCLCCSSGAPMFIINYWFSYVPFSCTFETDIHRNFIRNHPMI